MPHCLPRPLFLATALAVASAMAPQAASAQMTGPSTAPAAPAAPAAGGTLLSVSASAEASRVPDVASLSAGVVTQAADANAALRANAARMDEVMAAVRAAGVAERDVQTTGLNVNPQYHHTDNQPPRITGYEASNTVRVKVRDVGGLGAVLDALVASGANQVHGPSFEIDKPEAVYDEARRAALEKARARATMYADSLGLRVHRIVSVSEGGGFQPPQPMFKAMAMDRMESSPVSPGETTLSASLDVVFELR
jgi:uncharacterized protein